MPLPRRQGAHLAISLVAALLAAVALTAAVPGSAAAGPYPNPGSRECRKVVVGGYHRIFVRAAEIACGRARTISANWYRARRCWDFGAPAPARRTCRLGAWRCEARVDPADVSNIEIQALWARCRRSMAVITIRTYPEQD